MLSCEWLSSIADYSFSLGFMEVTRGLFESQAICIPVYGNKNWNDCLRWHRQFNDSGCFSALTQPRLKLPFFPKAKSRQPNTWLTPTYAFSLQTPGGIAQWAFELGETVYICF
ncbi:hypothetical protein EK904_004687 [Melospiza melodia maxima]|nr:hypothetical protein EK904_004687 [Melospiza melodia maxima]